MGRGRGRDGGAGEGGRKGFVSFIALCSELDK